jgi:hypothetical protein
MAKSEGGEQGTLTSCLYRPDQADHARHSILATKRHDDGQSKGQPQTADDEKRTLVACHDASICSIRPVYTSRYQPCFHSRRRGLHGIGTAAPPMRLLHVDISIYSILDVIAYAQGIPFQHSCDIDCLGLSILVSVGQGDDGEWVRLERCQCGKAQKDMLAAER